MTTGQAFAAASPSQEIAQRLAQAQQDGKVYGLHTLLVSQGGRLIIEHYGRGEDKAWGRPLGTVTFAPDVLHDLRSVSKSVVGLLYGTLHHRNYQSQRTFDRVGRAVAATPKPASRELHTRAPGMQVTDIGIEDFDMAHRLGRWYVLCDLTAASLPRPG